MLEADYLGLREDAVKRIIVVKFEVKDGGDSGPTCY